uniref:Ovule protein n=1 Tax=Caenorhabditis tropicalis TaxID=1561998 RepID=A0A1I7U9D4_9PELO
MHPPHHYSPSLPFPLYDDYLDESDCFQDDDDSDQYEEKCPNEEKKKSLTVEPRSDFHVILVNLLAFSFHKDAFIGVKNQEEVNVTDEVGR